MRTSSLCIRVQAPLPFICLPKELYLQESSKTPAANHSSTVPQFHFCIQHLDILLQEKAWRWTEMQWKAHSELLERETLMQHRSKTNCRSLLLIYWALWLVAQQAIKNDNWENLAQCNGIFNGDLGYFSCSFWKWASFSHHRVKTTMQSIFFSIVIYRHIFPQSWY